MNAITVCVGYADFLRLTLLSPSEEEEEDDDESSSEETSFPLEDFVKKLRFEFFLGGPKGLLRFIVSYKNQDNTSRKLLFFLETY